MQLGGLRSLHLCLVWFRTFCSWKKKSEGEPHIKTSIRQTLHPPPPLRHPRWVTWDRDTKKLPRLWMSSPWAHKPCAPDVLEQPLLREGWPRDQGRVFPLNTTVGEERKNAHSRFNIALAAGTVSIGRVARTGTNDSKHFVKWNSQMMSELRLL